MITGASGGSILAALLAIKTEEELLQEVLTEDFSTDFKVGGWWRRWVGERGVCLPPSRSFFLLPRAPHTE